ncbi:MAG: hypothetical protein ACSHX4_12715 [Opitutaceae bacterium]
MRIVFICGSLDPGRDGVGDYSRQLAHACLKNGHQCLLVSLNDAVNEDTNSEGIEIIRRQGLLDTNSESQAQLLERIVNWAPDWCSLQFVCFAFHPKGFTQNLFRFLSQFPVGIKRHVMFHELWIRQAPVMPFKLRILGLMQRCQILRAIRKWQPQLCHSSNPLYLHLLANNGIEAQALSLFGNIPIADQDIELAKEHLPWHPASKDERIVLVPFSQLDRWEVEASIERLFKLAKSAKVRLRLVQVGMDRNGEKRWQQIANLAERHGGTCDQLGPQEASTISTLMQAADIGMNSSHIDISQKSGAVLSMLEHGLPVLCAGITPESRLDIQSPKVAGLYSINASDSSIINWLQSPEKLSVESKLDAVAQQFSTDLQSIN